MNSLAFTAASSILLNLKAWRFILDLGKVLFIYCCWRLCDTVESSKTNGPRAENGPLSIFFPQRLQLYLLFFLSGWSWPSCHRDGWCVIMYGTLVTSRLTWWQVVVYGGRCDWWLCSNIHCDMNVLFYVSPLTPGWWPLTSSQWTLWVVLFWCSTTDIDIVRF